LSALIHRVEGSITRSAASERIYHVVLEGIVAAEHVTALHFRARRHGNFDAGLMFTNPVPQKGVRSAASSVANRCIMN
jgi:hypothetical protein